MGFVPCSNPTSDLNMWYSRSIMPDAWQYVVNVRPGWPCVRLLRVSGRASFICNVCLSRGSGWDPEMHVVCCRESKQATNQQTLPDRLAPVLLVPEIHSHVAGDAKQPTNNNCCVTVTDTEVCGYHHVTSPFTL